MNRKWFVTAGVLLLVAIMALGAVGSGAWLTDTETSRGDTFMAGILDLRVDGQDNPIVPITLGDMKPCDGVGGAEHSTIKYNYTLSNVGSIAGQPWIEIVNLVDYENCRNEPEKAVDTTGGCPGPGAGELSPNLFLQINAAGSGGFVYPHATGCIGGGRNCPLSVWTTLNPIGKGTWQVIDGESSTAPMVLEFALSCAAGNEIQSDSVEFDIVFHLDQVGMP